MVVCAGIVVPSEEGVLIISVSSSKVVPTPPNDAGLEDSMEFSVSEVCDVVSKMIVVDSVPNVDMSTLSDV